MEYTSFEQIITSLKTVMTKKTAAVAGAADRHVLEAVIEAEKMGIIIPLLIGDSYEIRKQLQQLGKNPGDYFIVQCDDSHKVGEIAVELIKQGKANFIMKGMAETKDILKPLVNKDNGLSTGRVMSHVAFNQLPGYHKLIINTDGGMMMYPTLEEKKQILLNAVEVLHKIGYEMPKAAVLCAVEVVNSKMRETLDAKELKEANLRGEIPGCIVEGPISYDLAMSAEIAKTKQFDCPYCGDFDILLVPNITAGNILGKSWTVTAGSKMAGIVVGAKIPVVITSRGSSTQEKLNSLALAACISAKEVGL